MHVLIYYGIENISVHSDGITNISNNAPTYNGLHIKCAHTIVSRYISTSDSGVVGGSGTAATV